MPQSSVQKNGWITCLAHAGQHHHGHGAASAGPEPHFMPPIIKAIPARQQPQANLARADIA